MTHGRRLIGLATLLAVGAAVAVATGTGAFASDSAQWRAKVDARVLAKASRGPTGFLVYMKTQADLTGAERLGWEARGWFVYNRLRATASASQRPIVAELKRAGVPYKTYWITNSIWAKAGTATIRTLAARPDVAHLYAVPKMKLIGAIRPATRVAHGVRATAAVGNNIAKVNADDVWALGFTGQGAVVASADTGVRWTHSALKSKYRGWNGTVGLHDYNWKDGITQSDPLNSCPSPQPQPCDDDELLGGGHGTHTTGTMVGSDAGNVNQVGMAPGATWIACRNMNRGVGEGPFDYATCMQWFIAPTKIDGNSPLPSLRPHVVNNSWGCVEACATPLLRAELQASIAAGIFYAVSAGNDGIGNPAPPPARGCNTIVHPLARYVESFTVGSTVIATDEISDFSSRGPVPPGPDTTGHRKPDIVAPGSDVRSSLAGSDSEYGTLSGTSMAGPHVAGLVALIISAKPSLAGQITQLRNIIEQSAVHLTSNEQCGGDTATQMPNNTYGWGRIDALAAVNLARGTTAVTVGSFRAAAAPDRVSIGWHAYSEGGQIGYNVWRSTRADGQYRLVNRTLIPAKRGLAGASYRYVDRTIRRGAIYHYKLETVGLVGASTWLGPVSVRAS